MSQTPSLKQMIEALEAAGLTQAEIAEKSGIAQGSISKIKSGKQRFVFHEKAESLSKIHQQIAVNKKAQSVA